MVIIVDTREQKNEHILSYFDKAGIKHVSRKLEYGDYSFYIPANEELDIPRDLYFDKEIIVERKGSLEEISGNFTTSRDRLEKEFTLAPERKVLLIEGDYGKLVSGNYNTQYSNKAFWASIHVMWHRYDLPTFFMPDNRYSGCFIFGYFRYYLKEYLR